MAEVKVRSDEHDRNTCLATTVTAKRVSDADVRVQLEAAFLAVPVERGVIVQVECYVGTTGARFEMLADGVAVRSVTEASSVETSYTVESEKGRAVALEPTLSAKSGQDELVASLGSLNRSGSQSNTVAFKGHESELAITHVRDSHVRWSLRSHRARRAYADYLEGTLKIEASAQWDGTGSASIAVTAQPTDIRYFGPDGAKLGRLASLGLHAKLLARRAAVPSRRVSRHDVFLTRNSG
jgi:hypothetical protein